MSDDWESVTKIGSKVRGTGAAPREKVIKGSSALNAAQRSGAVISTEKKYGGANSSGRSAEGQHLTKVDRSDDIVKPKTAGKPLGDLIKLARQKATVDGETMSQKYLADKCRTSSKVIQEWEKGGGTPPNQAQIKAMEKTLNVMLKGPKAGQPKEPKEPKKKE